MQSGTVSAEVRSMGNFSRVRLARLVRYGGISE